MQSCFIIMCRDESAFWLLLDAEHECFLLVINIWGVKRKRNFKIGPHAPAPLLNRKLQETLIIRKRSIQTSSSTYSLYHFIKKWFSCSYVRLIFLAFFFFIWCICSLFHICNGCFLQQKKNKKQKIWQLQTEKFVYCRFCMPFLLFIACILKI